MNTARVITSGRARWVSALMMLVGFAQAATFAGPSARAGIERGAQRATTCAACHGAHGQGNPDAGFPRLAGQTADYLVAQLRGFADGSRNNAVMTPIAKSLDPQAQADVAAFYANEAPPTVAQKSGSADARQLARGRLLVRVGDESKQLQACGNCHGADGAGEPHAAPYLAGQSTQYLESAIREWKSGSRTSGAALMGSVASRLDDSDIAAVSAYLSRLDRVSAR